MNHSDEVLSLITRTGIFEGREKQLMDMHRRIWLYRELLEKLFPTVKTYFVSRWAMKPGLSNIEKAASLMYCPSPYAVIAGRVYRVAAFYSLGATEQYREVL